MSSYPLVTIITINYNSFDHTLEFLDSLSRINYPNIETILVDNNSKSFDPIQLRSKYPDVVIHTSDKNLGFAGGNNVCLDRAKGDYIFFVNNDTIIERNCLNILVRSASSIENLGAISPKFHYHHTPNLIEYAGCPPINIFTARTEIIGSRRTDEGNYSGLIETSYAHGGGMLVPRHVINAIGKMREDYFLYYEELDWCTRMKKSGFKIYCQRDALIYHKESASVGRLSTLKIYYMNRSRVLFMRKNYSGINILLFYSFLLFVSIPKNVIKFLLLGEITKLKAYTRSLLWQVNPKFVYQEE